MFLISEVWAQDMGGAASGAGGASPIGMIFSYLPMIMIVGVMWLVLIRPQNQAARQKDLMLKALQAGDEVVLMSGIFGRIEAIDGDVLRLRVADGVLLKVARDAVGRKIAAGEGIEAAPVKAPVAKRKKK